jgi:hypothetical protein
MNERCEISPADQIALLTAEAERYSRTSLVPVFKSDIRVAAGQKERTLRAAVESLRRYEQLREAARRKLTRESAGACGHGVNAAEACQHCVEALLMAALEGR